jgi:hypothetical protein
LIKPDSRKATTAIIHHQTVNANFDTKKTLALAYLATFEPMKISPALDI